MPLNPPCGPIASASAPEGMSTATTGTWLAFKMAMASAYRPLTGGLNPVPRIASRYKSAGNASRTRSSFKSSLACTTIAATGSFSNISAASPRRSTRSAKSMTCTVFPARATVAPSQIRRRRCCPYRRKPQSSARCCNAPSHAPPRQTRHSP